MTTLCLSLKKNINVRVNSIKFCKTNNKKVCTPSSLYKQMPKVCISYNYSDFTRLSSILKFVNILTIPIVKKNFKSVIKLGKDRSDKWQTTNIVYKIDCLDCFAEYISVSMNIGGAVRMMILYFLNIASNTVMSSIGIIKAVILDRENNYKKRLFSEMLHIKFLKKFLIMCKFYNWCIVFITPVR